MDELTVGRRMDSTCFGEYKQFHPRRQFRQRQNRRVQCFTGKFIDFVKNPETPSWSLTDSDDRVGGDSDPAKTDPAQHHIILPAGIQGDRTAFRHHHSRRGLDGDEE